MPGRFDQQSADVCVAGFGHPTLGTALTGGILAGHQADVGADAAAGEQVPVADLDGQPERRQGGNAADTPESVHDRAEVAVGGHCGDRLIEAVASIHAGQHRVEGRLVAELQGRVVEALGT